jgi:hypothetical protein
LKVVTVDGLARELGRRGFTVSAVERVGDKTLVAFLVMGERNPAWRKGVEVSTPEATPDRICAEFGAWQAQILSDLALGKASPVVRRMIAEFGSDAVIQAMRPRHVG